MRTRRRWSGGIAAMVVVVALGSLAGPALATSTAQVEERTPVLLWASVEGQPLEPDTVADVPLTADGLPQDVAWLRLRVTADGAVRLLRALVAEAEPVSQLDDAAVEVLALECRPGAEWADELLLSDLQRPFGVRNAGGAAIAARVEAVDWGLGEPPAVDLVPVEGDGSCPAGEPEPADPTDPTEPVDPADPVDPTDPTEPVDPADPVDPTDPTEPVDPADPVEPKEPVEPTDPVDPADPSDGRPARPAPAPEPEPATPKPSAPKPPEQPRPESPSTAAPVPAGRDGVPSSRPAPLDEVVDPTDGWDDGPVVESWESWDDGGLDHPGWDDGSWDDGSWDDSAWGVAEDPAWTEPEPAGEVELALADDTGRPVAAAGDAIRPLAYRDFPTWIDDVLSLPFDPPTLEAAARLPQENPQAPAAEFLLSALVIGVAVRQLGRRATR